MIAYKSSHYFYAHDYRFSPGIFAGRNVPVIIFMRVPLSRLFMSFVIVVKLMGQANPAKKKYFVANAA